MTKLHFLENMIKRVNFSHEESNNTFIGILRQHFYWNTKTFLKISSTCSKEYRHTYFRFVMSWIVHFRTKSISLMGTSDSEPPLLVHIYMWGEQKRISRTLYFLTALHRK